jgi:hypothetical protein
MHHQDTDALGHAILQSAVITQGLEQQIRLLIRRDGVLRAYNGWQH